MGKTKLPLVPVLLAAFCAAAAGYAGTVEGAQAACAASMPSVRASPAEGAPGEPFRLQGEGFYGNFVCDDTGPPVSSRPQGGRPTDGIRVELLQGTKTWTLATVASGEDLEFDAGGLEVPGDAVPGEAVIRATSPSVDPRVPPPRDEAPFLVLDRLPETGGSGASVVVNDLQGRFAARVCLAADGPGRNCSSNATTERERGMAGIGKKVEGAAKKAASGKASGKKGKSSGGGSGAAKAKNAVNKLTK